jgi:hypothetical protein
MLAFIIGEYPMNRPRPAGETTKMTQDLNDERADHVADPSG